MSDKTVDESPDISKKKNEQNGTNKEDEFTWTNTKKFLTSIIWSIIMVLCYFGLSGCILYFSKVAQSNLMPTSANCAPYDSAEPIFSSNETTCNIFETIFEDPPLSEKIKFIYSDENKKNTVLDWLKNQILLTNSTLLYLFYSIIISIFVFLILNLWNLIIISPFQEQK